MADPAADAPSPPGEWPVHPDLRLILNRMGSFDWDLDTGLMHMDEVALAVFEMDPAEYDGRPETLERRFPPGEAERLDAMVAQALKDGSTHYGTYFRVRTRDGGRRWTHTQGFIRRDEHGRPRRVIGIVRDATPELAQSADRREIDAERRRRTGLVEATTAALAHARTVRDVIDVLKDPQGLAYLGAAGLAVGLLEAGRIHLVADGSGEPPAPGARHTRVGEDHPMSEVVRTLAPRFVESPEEFAGAYPALWQRIAPLGITAAAYLPLIAHARPIGAVGLLYRHKAGFAPEERNVLVALGSSIAQSLQRAVLFEQEHDLAEGLQQAMLPRRIPEVPGAQVAVRYRAARHGRDIGGDWYDLIPLPGGRVGAVIGDVQGHDTHAAAVMGQLRIVLRAYAAEGHTPATVMARASVFLRDLDTDRFATCTYMEVDPATGVVQAVRAGHVDPLLRDTDGGCRRLPVPGALPLGLSAEFDALDYPVGVLELAAGQTLVLFTDGLVERPGADLDEGMRWLTGFVRDGPADLRLLADRLCEAVGGRGGDDDVAILLLRLRGDRTPRAGGRFRQHVAQDDPEALHSARRMIRAALRAWGGGERSDDVELAAGELIVNALLHTDGAAVVTLRMLTAHGSRVRVEVEDRSSARPRRREAGADDVSGRGLLLVDRLADAWGVESRGTGKCVWCEFALPASSARPGEARETRRDLGAPAGGGGADGPAGLP